jgi:hypothetical protein
MHVWLQSGFRFIAHCKISLVTTLYSSLLNTHQCSLYVTVSSYLCQITFPINEDSSYYVLASLPAGKYPITELLLQLFLLKYLGNDCIEKPQLSCILIVATGTFCSQICYSVSADIHLLIWRSLCSNRYFFFSDGCDGDVQDRSCFLFFLALFPNWLLSNRLRCSLLNIRRPKLISYKISILPCV